jgi:ABC-type sugar transport system ATPase subunit
VRLDLGIRPEDLALVAEGSAEEERSDRPTVPARVERVEYQGHEVWVHLVVGGRILKSREVSRNPPREGDDVRILIRLDSACWFDRDSGEAIAGVEKPFAEVRTGC